MKPSERIKTIRLEKHGIGDWEGPTTRESSMIDAIYDYLDEQYEKNYQRKMGGQHELRERVKNRVAGALGVHFKMNKSQGEPLISKDDFMFLTEQIDKAIDEEFGR